MTDLPRIYFITSRRQALDDLLYRFNRRQASLPNLTTLRQELVALVTGRA